MEKELYSYKLYSHPDKLLKDHLLNVNDIGMRVYESEKVTNILNKEVLSAILLFHDIGKAGKDFQNKLLGTGIFHKQKSFHSDISAVLLLLYLEYKQLSIDELLLGFITIKRHHSNLNDSIEELLSIDEERKEYLKDVFESFDLGEVIEIYKDLIDTDFFSGTISDRIENFNTRRYRREVKNILTDNFDLYNKLNLYFSILVYSDKEDCIIKNKSLLLKKLVEPDFNAVNKYKTKNFGCTPNSMIDKVREKAYDEVEKNIDLSKRIYSINIPTGSGKTLTSLNCALKIMEKDKSIQRAIYCLPFTSVIDQNAEVFQNVFETDDSALLLKHHHLTELDYNSKYYKEEIFSDQESDYLIETWNSRIIVTTFYQLLNTMFSGANNLLKKYNRLSNSVIILDEIQSIPRKYWLLINNFFKYFAEKMNCYIILVTATMPLIFSETENEITELAISKKEYYQFFGRITLDVSESNNKIQVNDFSEKLLNEITETDKSILIICNTIKSSILIYDYLKLHEVCNLSYISSNVIPIERLRIINELKDKSKRRILVSTQVIEAGVDISFDIVYRDMAPLDSIFQACGRCNRNGDKLEKGIVKVVRLINENGKDYSKIIYDEVILSKTEEVFKGKGIIYEKDFLELSGEYFLLTKKATSVETSFNIIESIKKMDYKKAFYDKYSFKLIDDSFNTLSCFIQYDDKSSELYNEYLSLLRNERTFENNTKIKKIYREMSAYIINVPKKFLPEGNTDNLFVIDRDMLTQYYSSETGFKREDKAEDYIF